MAKSADEVHCKCSLRKTLKIINIILGSLMVALGIYSYIESDNIFVDGWWKSPWVVFIPFYSILFGLVLILLEFEIHFIQIYFIFLNNYFGKGLYLIYLATIAAGNMPDMDDIIVYVSSGVFALTGIFYILLGFCVRDKADRLRESLIDKTASMRKDLKESQLQEKKKKDEKV